MAFVDPLGLDAILINKRLDLAPKGFVDHTSGFFQDGNKDWWFFYFGEEVRYSKVILDDEFTSYDSIFESIDSINAYLWKHKEYKKEEAPYNSSVYVKGDFIASHEAAMDMSIEYKDGIRHKDIPLWDWPGNLINYAMKADNSDYRLFTNNCTQNTMRLFFQGTLPDGTNVGLYAALNGYGIDVLPNNNMWICKYFSAIRPITWKGLMQPCKLCVIELINLFLRMSFILE